MPYLEIIEGPGAGTRFELKEPFVVMGRHPDCDFVLDVGAVSRQHAKLKRDGGRYLLEDLKSRNGTTLNDAPLLQPRALTAGDEFQICDVRLAYRDEKVKTSRRPRNPAPSPAPDTAAVGDTDVNEYDSSWGAFLADDAADSSAQIMGTIGVSTGSGTVQIAASADAKLAALIEINRHLGRRLSLDQVLPEVLEGLFKIFIQADRGFIVLQDERGNLVPRWTKLRREDANDSLRISRTIVKQVVESKEAILSADAASDQQFQMSQSIADFRIRSMMCAPLIDGEGDAIGVLQVDTLDPRKKFKQEDLEVLASVAGQAGVAIDNARMHEAALARVELDKDLELAKRVQQVLVPEKGPDIAGYEFFSFYRAANQVGGDYFDYVPLSEGRVAVVVADVVGHGVAAALLMARLSSQVRFCLAGGLEPGKALAQVNAAFGEIGIESRFVTFWLGVLDPNKKTLTVANAGHMPTMIRRGKGDVIEVGQEETGFPLGVLDDTEYDEITIDLLPGHMVTMYTDGVNEASNPKDELYDIQRIRDRFAADRLSPKKFGEGLIADVQRFMNGAPQGDDMCLVCFGRVK